MITLLSLVMAVSGMFLKYQNATARLMPFIDLGFMRYLHNRLSPWFGLALVLMAVTGLMMYVYPILQRRKAK
ncbi:hypothetical protein M1523_03220 [Patescibacteria group bacterium]|nr:hypothetical protein [Patescibacteria group bacterium]MCL5091268.1 hypothetical protein [Patescibacteria group bacterium]